GDSVVPRLPSRCLSGVASACVVDHPLIERVTDLAFERAERALAGHSVGDLLVVVGAALAAAVADLADRGHMDDVVQLPVPAPGQPVDRPVAGGDLDRGGAVVGGEPVAVREAADVAHVAE